MEIKRMDAIQPIRIDGEGYRGLVLDGNNLSKYMKIRGGGAIIGMSRYDLPDELRNKTIPEGFDEEGRSEFNKEKDFLIVTPDEESAKKFANLILRPYGMEHDPDGDFDKGWWNCLLTFADIITLKSACPEDYIYEQLGAAGVTSDEIECILESSLLMSDRTRNVLEGYLTCINN